MGLRKELEDTIDAIIAVGKKHPGLESIECNGCKVVFSRQLEPEKDDISKADAAKVFGPAIGDKPPELIKEGRYKGFPAEDVFAAAVPQSDS